MVAIAFRVWRLGTVPGINGDEAWYGVQMEQLAAGQRFEWKTPPGNLLNPFHSGVLLVLLRAFAPEFWILRAPAFVSSVAAVFACAVLWRSFLQPRLSWVAALLFASLPVTIAYARFGWDASQSILAGIVLVYGLMQERWLLAWCALGAAVWIHPTNILLAPLVLAHFLFRQPATRWGLSIRLAAGLAMLAALRHLFVPSGFTATLSVLTGRLTSLETWASFGALFGQLFSGVTSYTYIVGTMASLNRSLHDAILWSAVASVVILGGGSFFRNGSRASHVHAVGMIGVLMAFYSFGGLRALTPHYERYGLGLVAPSVLMFVVLLGHALDRLSRQTVAVWVGCVLAAACLISVQFNYLTRLASTGGESHRTFRTSATEPKKAALAFIVERSTQQMDCIATRVIAEDWWLYWPLRYLIDNAPRFEVTLSTEQSIDGLIGGLDRCSYLVGFSGGPFESRVAQKGVSATRTTFDDPVRRPILFVWQGNDPRLP
jgi:hypothetical protein